VTQKVKMSAASKSGRQAKRVERPCADDCGCRRCRASEEGPVVRISWRPFQATRPSFEKVHTRNRVRLFIIMLQASESRGEPFLRHNKWGEG